MSPTADRIDISGLPADDYDHSVFGWSLKIASTPEPRGLSSRGFDSRFARPAHDTRLRASENNA